MPAFIAVNYVMNFYDKHDITGKSSLISYSEIDTVYIRKSLTFNQVCRTAGISMEVMDWLNPMYSKKFIPVEDEPVRLFLPADKVISFIRGEADLEPQSEPEVVVIPLGDKNDKERVLHMVRKGEFFHKIAVEYECRIGDIMVWNNLESKELTAGQELVIWRPKRKNQFFFVNSEVLRCPTYSTSGDFVTVVSMGVR